MSIDRLTVYCVSSDSSVIFSSHLSYHVTHYAFMVIRSTFMDHLLLPQLIEPEANERGSSLISRRLHYRGLQSLFLTKRKELWLCANGRLRMRSCMPQGIVVMRE